MKIIIGILKDNSDKVQSYIDQGYHIEYLDEHARNFGEALFKKELTDEEVQRVRDKGYNISSRYWVNYALMCARAETRIVIADLREEDNKTPFSKVI